MNLPISKRVTELTAILIAPDRTLAGQFVASIAETRAFQVLSDVKNYLPEQTLEIRLRQLKPDVVLVDAASDCSQACTLIETVVRLSSDAHVVALHHESDSDAILRTLRAGATEFMHAPFDQAMLTEVVERLLRLRKVEPEQSGDLASTVIFSSVKPGSGASTLATQTAFALKRLTGKRVLLADFDLTGGTIGFYLKLGHSYSLVDALQHAEHLDAALWTSLVQNSGGVDILSAPAAPYSEPIDASRVQVVLDYARAYYDWIVIDLPSVFQRLSLITVSQAERTFLVSTAELPSLHLARKAVTLLEQLGCPKERFQIIVNRVSKRDGISTGDMEKLFNCSVHASFPNDYFSLHRVVTLGQPLGSDGELGRAIDGLAGKLSGSARATKRSSTSVAGVKFAFSLL